MPTVLLHVLTIVLVGTLFVSIGMNLVPFLDSSSSVGCLLNIAAWAPDKPFTHLPALVVSAAALIAILAYRRERDRAVLENQRSRSEFFFRQASHGLDEVFDLLRDRNNDRIIWVRAARSLLQAKKLANDIELEEYQRTYRLYELRIRNELYLALTIYDQSSGRRHAVPPQFFYGVSDWTSGKTLDEVAIETSNPIEPCSLVLDEVPPEPHSKPLSERSIVAIFDFLDYPEDYENPLDDVRVWSEDWADVHGARSGAARYIAHRQTKYAGKTYDRSSKDNKG